MKFTKQLIYALIVLVVLSALYRIIPGRPLGFAPQIAIALFAGSVIRNKKYAFAIPLLSMFISDVLYEILYMNGLSSLKGFYNGQLVNYILFTGLTVVGFYIRKNKPLQIGAGAIIAPTAYFLASNFAVWLGDNMINYPKTFDGLMQAYIAGIPFYRGSIFATLIFCAILFGGYALLKQEQTKTAHQAD